MLCDREEQGHFQIKASTGNTIRTSPDDALDEYRVQVYLTGSSLQIGATHFYNHTSYETKILKEEEDIDILYRMINHSFQNSTMGTFVTSLKKIDANTLVLYAYTRDYYIVKRCQLTKTTSSSPKSNLQMLAVEKTILELSNTVHTTLCDIARTKPKLTKMYEFHTVTSTLVGRSEKQTLLNETPQVVCPDINHQQCELQFGFIPSGTISIKFAVNYKSALPPNSKHGDRLDMFVVQKGFQKNQDRHLNYHHCSRCGADQQILDVPWRVDPMQKATLCMIPTSYAAGTPKGNYSISIVSFTTNAKDSFLNDLR
jgi:hypothetical protein